MNWLILGFRVILIGRQLASINGIFDMPRRQFSTDEHGWARSRRNRRSILRGMRSLPSGALPNNQPLARAVFSLSPRGTNGERVGERGRRTLSSTRRGGEGWGEEALKVHAEAQHPPQESINLAFGQAFLIHLASVSIGSQRIIFLILLDEALFLRPALIHSL